MRLNNSLLKEETIQQIKREIKLFFELNQNTAGALIEWDTFKAYIKKIFIKIGGWN